MVEEISKEVLDFYKNQGERTKVDEGLFKNFPEDIAEIVNVIQGILLHRASIKLYSIKVPEERYKNLNIKSVQEIFDTLKELNSSPIFKKRKPEERVIVTCKHFASVLASILRSKGISARARCGFALYFKKGWFEDHWICEYWNGKRWVKVDSQLDNVLLKYLGISREQVRPLDLHAGEFFYGGDVWKMYRKGLISGEICGFSLKPDLYGDWYIRGNMLRDFFSLNGVECIYLEENKLMSPKYEPSNKDLTFLDNVAELTTNVDRNFKKLRKLYEKRKDLRPYLS